MPRLEPPPYNHCRGGCCNLHADAFVSAQGFVDNESTLRSISWALHNVDTYGVTANTSVHQSEYSTDNSRHAEQAGTVDTVFDNYILGLTRGSQYKVKFTGKNGANLTTEVWSKVFSYDDTSPDVTGGLATLCPPTSALRLDLRGRFDCGSWPTLLSNDLNRHQASTSLLKVTAGAHSRPVRTHVLTPTSVSHVRASPLFSVARVACTDAVEGLCRPREPGRLVRTARDRSSRWRGGVARGRRAMRRY